MSKGTITITLEDLIKFAHDEVFTFVGNERGKREVYHFNATRIREYIETQRATDPSVAEFQVVPLTDENIRHIRDNNGVEIDKLARLAQRPDLYCQPVLLCDMGHHDGKDWHVMIDGNHRSVLLHGMGIYRIPAWLVPEKTWRQFLIDMPDDPDLIEALLK